MTGLPFGRSNNASSRLGFGEDFSNFFAPSFHDPFDWFHRSLAAPSFFMPRMPFLMPPMAFSSHYDPPVATYSALPWSAMATQPQAMWYPALPGTATSTLQPVIAHASTRPSPPLITAPPTSEPSRMFTGKQVASMLRELSSKSGLQGTEGMDRANALLRNQLETLDSSTVQYTDEKAASEIGSFAKKYLESLPEKADTGALASVFNDWVKEHGLPIPTAVTTVGTNATATADTFTDDRRRSIPGAFPAPEVIEHEDLNAPSDISPRTRLLEASA